MSTPRSLARRVRRSRTLEPLKRAVRSQRDRGKPLLSVVVAVRDAETLLPACLDSLLAHESVRIEVVVVDDGSTDGTRAVAEQYAARHRQVRLVPQEPAGVGAARARGLRQATGDYLAFCDADDVVPAQGYARLVEVLESSGSDLAVGSVAIQEKGQFRQPEWARRSNPARRAAVRPDQAPELLGNLVLGARVFRRSAWDAAGWAFESADERSDARLVVRSLLESARVDMIPAVVYRWSWRQDNRSLHQRDLYDQDRVADRVRSLASAGEPLAERGSDEMRSVFFSEVLHSTVPSLVRAAVCRDDGYWDALHHGLATLLAGIPASTLDRVPVADRITAWLCAQDERAATEQYLEYATDNEFGFPFDMVDGRPRIALPFVDALSSAPASLTLVADADMRYRARLTRVGWSAPDRLRVEGAAFLEYLDDGCGPSELTLVLTDASTGQVHRVPARPADGIGVNHWCQRANEDHTGAGFVAEVDVTALGSAATELEVAVELRLAGFETVGAFRSRNGSGAAGLLEPSEVAGTAYLPAWRDHQGLQIVVAPDRLPAPYEPPSDVVADTVSAAGHRLRVEGRVAAQAEELEVALVGPRASTDWTAATPDGDRFTVDLDLLQDEWGIEPTSLPADTYEVHARVRRRPVRVTTSAALWRSLPAPFDHGQWTLVPSVAGRGGLNVRVVPVDWQHSRASYHRRRMRDQLYVESREKPLLDVVLFETFAGKGTGDNPGAICAEFASRDLGLDLVYAVIDHSNVVPAGARAVIRWSAEWFELLGRARYLVVNASLPYFFRKREGQLYYQTWHGTPLKRIAHDRPHLDFFNWHHRRQLLVARDGWDWLLSQSSACTEFLSSAFRYTGPVMEVGYPRNDLLASDDGDAVRRRVRSHFAIPDDATVVLYAPTWRDNARVGVVFDKVLYLDPAELVAGVEDSYLLVRGHYNSVGAAEDRSTSARVLDVTRYPDIADLYLAADVLVTDYSSVFFDFVITDKPMVFLAPDLAAYRDDNRGFYLDYHETVPGPVCVTTAEVVAAINAPDDRGPARARFREQFAPLDDGRAAARVVDAILTSYPMPDA